MKLLSFYATLLVTSFSAIGLAEILLEPLPLRLYSGDACELHWATDRDYVSMHDVQGSIGLQAGTNLLFLIDFGTSSSPAL